MGKETKRNVNTSTGKLNVYLEEYKALRSEIFHWVEFQQRLLNYSLIVTGIVGALLVRNSENPNEAFTSIGPWPLLLSALVFLFFSWSLSNDDIMIVCSAKYINRVLRPKIEEIVGGKAIEWEDFLLVERNKIKKRLLLPGLGQEYPLLLAATILTFVFVKFIYGKYFEETSKPLLIFFAVDVVCLFMAIIFRAWVSYNYYDISDRRKKQGGAKIAPLSLLKK